MEGGAARNHPSRHALTPQPTSSAPQDRYTHPSLHRPSDSPPDKTTALTRPKRSESNLPISKQMSTIRNIGRTLGKKAKEAARKTRDWMRDLRNGKKERRTQRDGWRYLGGDSDEENSSHNNRGRAQAIENSSHHLRPTTSSRRKEKPRGGRGSRSRPRVRVL